MFSILLTPRNSTDGNHEQSFSSLLFWLFFFCHYSLDFSGQSGPRLMRGYVTKTEYEMLGDGTTKETPQNKFNRLQHEIRELAEELEHIKVSSLSLLIVDKVKKITTNENCFCFCFCFCKILRNKVIELSQSVSFFCFWWSWIQQLVTRQCGINWQEFSHIRQLLTYCQ